MTQGVSVWEEYPGWVGVAACNQIMIGSLACHLPGASASPCVKWGSNGPLVGLLCESGIRGLWGSRHAVGVQHIVDIVMVQ